MGLEAMLSYMSDPLSLYNDINADLANIEQNYAESYYYNFIVREGEVNKEKHLINDIYPLLLDVSNYMAGIEDAAAAIPTVTVDTRLKFFSYVLANFEGPCGGRE